MASWDETLRELRGDFVRGTLERLARMRGLAGRLRGDPEQPQVWRELMLQFHGLAGAGTTYGFPEVTRLGLLGERLSSGKDDRGPGSAAALAAVAAAIDDLGRAVRQGEAGVSRLSEPAPIEAAPDPTPPPRARVLLVEDDAEWARVFRQRLEAEGYDVQVAATRAEAEAVLHARLPDALVCDVLLPDGSGYELVAAVRRLPQADELPILMASVRNEFLDKVEAITSGADGFFEKPLDWEALLARMQHLLERRELEPGRVLCVEDFDEQATFLRSVLASAGYVVETLDDPSRFEAELAAFRPNIVLMDVLLPGVSGFHLTRYVRQHPRFASLPVVFLTTEAQAESRIQGLKAGGDDYLVKPVSPPLLLTAVAAHLERARLLRSLMERDGLTRLLTHSAFVERAKQAYEKARRRPEPAPLLLMLDLDSFKSVNDRFGHPTGDRVLAAFAALLRRRVRHSDVMGRYGGEEFSVLLEGISEADGLRLADRLRSDFAAMEHQAANGMPFRVTLSAGLSRLDTTAMSFDAWATAADEALYAAKAQGRDRVVVAPRAAEGREA